MMEQQEVEEVSFLPGEAILNKKAVYEPTKGQKFRQVVCSKTWAICILFTMAVIIIAVAAMAAFARPGLSSSSSCTNTAQMANGTSTASATTRPKILNYTATNGEPFPWHDIRLPKSVVPQNYDIFLHPNITASFFDGNVTMTLAVKERTDFVVFHTHELNLTAVKVSIITHSGASGASGSRTVPGSSKSGYIVEHEMKVNVVKQLNFLSHQQMYIKLGQALEAGRIIKLIIGFRGSLEGLERMNGFYKSSYTVNGQQRFMASTHFEASSARRAFPCFDEPALKATFSMSIVRDSNHITLFNTPLKNTLPFPGSTLLVDNYEKTVRMSTYLVAYVVCDFKSISSSTKDGVMVRVFAPDDKIYMGQFALEGAVKIIEYYNDFFGIAYPLSKQDLIAIPNFAAGAMENWGLITYRDTAILYDPKLSTQQAKQWVATVVAHELAHQWFGNLVTMTWWNDIWLNEGFATFVEFIGADVVDKTFHMDEEYTMPWTTALYLDSLSSSHPIEIPVHDPEEVEAAFDSISYDKGAMLIRMLRSVIGQANFKTGLSDYLHQHAYGNAETKDLWDAFEKVSGLPADLHVDKVMDTWTKQMGYPLVTVVRKAGKLFLMQERFLLNTDSEKIDNTSSPFGYKWHVPFTYTTSEDPSTSHTVWMKMGSAEATLPSSNSPVWIKGNVKSQGFYRVNYDEDGWKALSQQLKTNHEVFSVQDRVGLMNDVFNLAWTGIIDYSVALDLSQYLVKEENYFVLDTAMAHLSTLNKRLYLHESYDNLKALMLSLITTKVESLGWDNKGDHLERKMRTLIINQATLLQYQPAVDRAKSLFESWKGNQSIVLNNDLRSLIYSTGVKHGTKKDWDLVFERFKKCKVPSETSILRNSLSASMDARTLQILMEYSLDSKKIKSQDTASVIAGVSNNPVGFLYAWRFLQEKWDVFFQRYGHGSFTLKGLLKGVISKFSTQFDYDEVTAFFDGKDLGSGASGLKQAKEVVMSHIIWEKKNLDKVSNWLKDPSRNFNQDR